MEIEIHDTWVKAEDGHTMHFDVAVPKGKGNEFAIQSGRKYLDSVGQKNAKISSKECDFCHTQGASPEVEKEINEKGYGIIKMEGCP